MRSELPIFGSSSRMRMRWAGMLIIHRIVTWAAANRIVGPVQFDSNSMVALLLNVGRRVGQQVLSMDLLTDLGDCILERMLLKERVLAAAGIAREDGKWILDDYGLYSAVDFRSEERRIGKEGRSRWS